MPGTHFFKLYLHGSNKNNTKQNRLDLLLASWMQKLNIKLQENLILKFMVKMLLQLVILKN